MQLYASPFFAKMRDYVDHLFCNLAPPVPQTVKPSGSVGSVGSGGGAFSMSSYSCASGGCVSGDSRVKLINGTMLPASQVRRGHIVLVTTADGTQTYARIRYVLCTKLTLEERKHVFLYRIGDLRITAWHPVRVLIEESQSTTSSWQFPCEVKDAWKEADAALLDDAIFSFALESVTSLSVVGLQVGGMDVLSLGHGMTNDAVAAHAYFGSDRIIADLHRLDQEQNESGYVTVTPSYFQRSNVDGQINAIRTP